MNLANSKKIDYNNFIIITWSGIKGKLFCAVCREVVKSTQQVTRTIHFPCHYILDEKRRHHFAAFWVFSGVE